MKVLILSSNNGGGHNAVAAALQECFTAHGDKCVIRDCLSFLSEKLSELVSCSHNYVYRHIPELFDSGYRRSEDNPLLFKEHHSVRNMIDLGRFALGKCIQSEHFEVVLCTHVFAAMMLTAAKKQYGLTVRTGIVETDYGNTPGFADNEMDLHFLPDLSLVPELLAAGIDESRIIASGIPVRRNLLTATDKTEARRILGLPPEHRHLLIMGGSMGCGPIPDLLNRLYAELDDTTQISVVCGSNARLQRSLAADYRHLSNVHVLGYVTDMSLLYDSADLLVTKPGGITVTEAAIKALPMVLINAVAGCEAHNLTFFLRKGGAVTGETIDELCTCSVSLLENQESLCQLSAALRSFASQNAAEVIYAAMTAPGHSNANGENNPVHP